MRQRMFNHNLVHHKLTTHSSLSLKKKIEKSYARVHFSMFQLKTVTKLVLRQRVAQTAQGNSVFLSYSLNSLKISTLMHFYKLFHKLSNKSVSHSLNRKNIQLPQEVLDYICHQIQILLVANLLNSYSLLLMTTKLTAWPVAIKITVWQMAIKPVVTEMQQPQSFSMKLIKITIII